MQDKNIQRTPFENGEIRRIAIFRALQLGDMLCAIPAIRAIKTTFPDASLTLVGLPWQHRFVKRFSHYFDDFLEFPGWPGLPERPYDLAGIMTFLQRMQQAKFDLIIQMQGNGYIVNPMCMLFGSKYVAGLRKAEDYQPNDRLFPVMEEHEHEITRFMKVVEALGGRPHGYDLEFPVLQEEEENFRSIQEHVRLVPGQYVCVHPGARDPRRRWSAQNFARVANSIGSRGYTILLTGSQEEKEVLADVQLHLRVPCINLVEELGQVGIGELALLIRESAGLISNDTGVSHIACALQVRSVIIFSRYSDPARWAPLECHRHRVIRAEESANIAYVINTTLHHLDMKHNEKKIEQLT